MIGWFSAAVIGAVRSSLFQCVVPSVVHCRMVLLLLCFLIVGIHASRISIPLSLLMFFWVKSYVNRLFDPACVTSEVHDQ